MKQKRKQTRIEKKHGNVDNFFKSREEKRKEKFATEKKWDVFQTERQEAWEA